MDFNNIYSVNIDNGTLIINKLNVDEYNKRIDIYNVLPDIILGNVNLDINDVGVLTIKGYKISYKEIYNEWFDEYDYKKIFNPVPIEDLYESVINSIYYTNDDIIDINITSRPWIFGKKKTTKVPHLKSGFYIIKKLDFTKYITMNYIIIDSETDKFEKQIING